MNSDQGTELRSGRIISSSLETPVPTDPDMAQSSANDSDSNETSDISSQLSEIRESYERKINELQNEFSQLKDLMMAVISKTDSENRPSTSKGPSKPAHTVGLDSGTLEPITTIIFLTYTKSVRMCFQTKVIAPVLRNVCAGVVQFTFIIAHPSDKNSIAANYLSCTEIDPQEKGEDVETRLIEVNLHRSIGR